MILTEFTSTSERSPVQPETGVTRPVNVTSATMERGIHGNLNLYFEVSVFESELGINYFLIYCKVESLHTWMK